MSLLASAKSYLIGSSGVLAAQVPAGVKVAYSMPRDVPTEVVYGGSVGGLVELAAFAGGGRVRRVENLVLMLHVRVYTKGRRDSEASEARAVVIGDTVAAYIAANPTLGGLTDLKVAKVAEVEMDSWLDDYGAGTTLDISVALMSYLT